MYLAIDTATDNAGIALRDDGSIRAVLAWRTRQNHSVELLPNVERLLAAAGVELPEINGIVVSRGPGSYNGLRVGLSTAKGLAYSRELPVVGISTLEAAALAAARSGLPVRVMFTAGGGEYATGVYRLADGALREAVPPALAKPAAIIQQTTETTLFCGEIADVDRISIKDAIPEKARLLPDCGGSDRVVSLAELGARRLEKGDCDEVATLEPVYLRQPPITQSKRR